VERGEIVGRVKNTMVSGNIFDALKELGPIGAEAKWVGGTLRTPAICCSRLGVASKG
jgi:PmbA protein